MATYKYQQNLFEGSSYGYVKYNITPDFGTPVAPGEMITITGQAYCKNMAVKSIEVKAMQAIDSFRGSSSVETYLCSIAHNLFVSDVRKSNKLTDARSLEERASDMDIERETAQKDEAIRIHILLHGLPEPYKEAFTLRVFGELSYAEIGTVFGKSENWARVTYFRAKQLLQKLTKEDAK